MPTDNRATAERIAREVFDERHGGPPNGYFADTLTKCVLAGMAHRDRTAEREAASKAWDAAIEAARQWDVPRSFGVSMERERDKFLAAEFDAGERVTLSDVSVVTLSGCGNYLVVTSHSEPPRTWRVDQWRHVPHTGADFDAVKRLAEQRGAER